MKKFLSVLVIVVFAAALCAGAYFGIPALNLNKKNENTEIKFSNYNTDEIVTLGEYKNLTVDVKYKAVTDESIIAYINDVLKYNPGYVKNEDTVVDKGDFVNFNYSGTEVGAEKPFDETDGYVLEIGSGMFIEGFEDGMIGAKVGDVLTLELTFPSDYKDGYGNISELAGKAAVFTVEINYIADEVISTYESIDDGYCYTEFGFETKQALYDYVKELMESDMEKEKESNTRTAVLEVVVKNATVEVPEELLEKQLNDYWDSFKADVEKAGYELTKYLDSYYKTTEEEYLKELKAYMEESLGQQFVFMAIAKKENIQLDEEGYADYIEAFVKYYGYANEEELYKDYPEDEIRTAYHSNQVLDYLMEGYTFNYVAE